MEELVAEINRALRRRGLSAREASMRAVGSPELVRDMRRGYVTSVAKFQALCEVLDLEFYVGARRGRPLSTSDGLSWPSRWRSRSRRS